MIPTCGTNRTIRNLLAAIFIAAAFQTHAQGVVYDQQSTIPPTTLGDYLDIQPEPLTQSFVPTLSAIGFVQFELLDLPNNGNNGATVYVNLWTGSPNTRSATLLGSTIPVYMPDGFGWGFPGVTNFYFALAIALTPGQTYYLQPVVQSGDNPFDVSDPGDTYPNGQLFVGGEAFPTDLWFREGVVVPEPTTLALLGISGILAYAFKRRSKLFVLLGTGMLLFGSGYAQTISVQSAPDSVVRIAADAAGLAPVSTTALPGTGTFWVVSPGPDGRLQTLPYPILPPDLSCLPTYAAAGNNFLVDDTAGQIMPLSAGPMSSAQTASTVQAQAQIVADLIEQIQTSTNAGTQLFQPNGLNLSVITNGLWLEVLSPLPGPTNTNVWLQLNGVTNDDAFQLLSTTSLTCTNWDLGEILWLGDDDSTDFSPVPLTNAVTFYRVHHANPVMQLWNAQNSEELNPTNANDPGYSGIVSIYNGNQAHGLTTNDITVYYTVSGTAQGGIDYSNLPGVLTIPAGQWSADIPILPYADGLKPDQTIIFTLVQNTNYLIDTDYVSATNTLFANPEVYPTARGDKEPVCPNTQKSIDLSLDVGNPLGLPLTYTVLTWPTNGTLDTSALPSVTYTPTSCYEGQDSFTFNVSDGRFTSAPATVTLIVSSQVYGNPITAQTCSGTPVGFTLSGSDNCYQGVSYAVPSNPLHGTATNQSGQSTDPHYIYTPTDPSFTGTDTFNYETIDECGYSATATVSVTVGDPNISPNGQAVMTWTNQPVNITLTADSRCANAFEYFIVSEPAYGTLRHKPPKVFYTPNTNYEGVDSFQFTVSDGVWTTTNLATVTTYVVAGPILTAGCNLFAVGPFVQLDWNLDNAVQQMEQQYKFISDYKLYRGPVSGGPYTCIYSNSDLSQMSYMDTNAVVGQTNYYVATFGLQDSGSGNTYESPFSNEFVAAGQNPNDLLAPDAVWAVWDVSTNHPVVSLGDLQTPFSSEYPNQYQDLYPLPNTYWPTQTAGGVPSIWSNSIALVIPTNVVLSQVKYSIAIDNDYWLYLNNLNTYIDTTNHEGYAEWGTFKTLAPGLHYGTNNLTVVIRDRGDKDYFSMVVTTNTCGQ
jgi:hypothetical protein